MSYFRSWFIHLVKKKLPPLIFYAFCTYSDHQSSKFRSERVICDTLVINTLLFTKYTIKGKELNYLQIESFFTLPEQYKLIDSIYGQAFSINSYMYRSFRHFVVNKVIHSSRYPFFVRRRTFSRSTPTPYFSTID